MRSLYSVMNRTEGRAECRVTGLEIPAFLNRCAGGGIPVLSAEPGEESSICLTLRAGDAAQARNLALRCGCELQVLGVTGGKRLGKRFLRRGLPILCGVLLLTALAVSKLFIWETAVTGNETVPTAKILSALADCGVGPGCFWPTLTADNLRSELLVKLPELAWVTVNIRGSRAEAVVRERVKKPVLYGETEPADLISARTGFVTEILALRGTALVRRGSAVLPGDVLISGESDSGFSGRRWEHALGTVTAETFYELSAVVPAQRLATGEGEATKTHWALRVGKKRVNFFGNSSICPPNCDKITKEWDLEAEGLFSLPVSLLRERYVLWAPFAEGRDENAACREMEQLLHERLLTALGAEGTVESESFSRCRSGEGITVCLRARCSENIAAEQKRMQED